MTAGANSLTARATKQVPDGYASVVQCRAVVDGFARLGYDVERILPEIGIDRAELDDPDGSMPLDKIVAVFQRTQRERPLTNVFLKLAAATPIGAYQYLDYLIVTSDTVGEGIRQLARYMRLANPGVLIEVREDEDPVRVAISVPPPGLPASVEYGVALLVRGMRAETEDRMRFEWVSLIHEPDDVAEMERVLGCPVRTGASWSGAALSREAWNMPLKRRDPVLRDILRGAVDAAFSRAEALTGTPFELRRVLSARLARGETEIAHVARALGTSSRTLQRRLSSAGLSYRSLLDDVRRETAERSLADSPLSIGEIAYLAGYSEPAAFHRAFKRWTGLTPQAYRQRLRSRRA